MPKIGQYWLSTELYYTTEHTWARIEGDTARFGVDDFVGKTAGQILFVEMQQVGQQVEHMKSFKQIETGKWVRELHAPFTGRTVAVNEEVTRNPQLISDDPYGARWLIQIQPSKINEEIPKLLHGQLAVEWLKQESETKKMST
jgi:glycine cleavage system H protein